MLRMLLRWRPVHYVIAFFGVLFNADEGAKAILDKLNEEDASKSSRPGQGHAS